MLQMYTLKANKLCNQDIKTKNKTKMNKKTISITTRVQ